MKAAGKMLLLPQRWRCLRFLFLCALTSVLLLVAHHTMLQSRRAAALGYGNIRSPVASIVSLLNESLASMNNESADSTQSTAAIAHPAAAGSDLKLPTGWRHLAGPVNGSFRVVYPNLYTNMRPLRNYADASFTAAIARRNQQHKSATSKASSSQTTTATTACKRPQAHNLAAEVLLSGQQSLPPPPPPPETPSGGFWLPQNCWQPLSTTAVIVPYRNRSDNLDQFVPYMHALLRKQNVAFAIFVVEQANARLFNRAKLINVGFALSQRFHAFDCYVFQDADKVPENVANVFDCANAPKLLISEMRPSHGGASAKYIKGKLYTNFFGGAVAITREAFAKINGNSNRYYGWGREDDELAARLALTGRRIYYNTGAESRFVNLRHSDDIVVNKMPWPYTNKVRQSMAKDGLNSLNFTNMGMYLHPMFVLIRADV